MLWPANLLLEGKLMGSQIVIRRMIGVYGIRARELITELSCLVICREVSWIHWPP